MDESGCFNISGVKCNTPKCKYIAKSLFFQCVKVSFTFLLFGIMCWDFLGFLSPLVASSKLATILVGRKKLLLVIFVILLRQIFRRLTIKAIFIKEESNDKLQLEARKISLSYLMNRFLFIGFSIAVWYLEWSWLANQAFQLFLQID